MNPDDPQVTIRATIDSSGAVAGAQEATAALAGVEGATVAASEASTAAGKVADLAALGNIRSVHHLLSGLLELNQGGVAALGGLAAEGRVATEVFEGMLGPLAPLALVISTITMLAVPMFEKWDEHQQKIAEGKDGVDDYASAWKDAATEIVSALSQILDAQEKVTRADQEDLAAIKEKATLADKQSKLDEKAAIEKLRSKYIQDEQNPDLTEEQRKQLKNRFEAGKKDIEDQTTVHSAEADRDAKFQEYGNLDKTRYDQQQQVNANQELVESLAKIQQDAKNFISGNDLSQDKDGKIVNAQGEDEVARRQTTARDAEFDYEESKKDRTSVGNMGVTVVTPSDPAEVARLKKIADQAQKDLQDLLNAGQNANSGEAVKKAQEALDKSTEALAKTVEKIPTALAEYRQADQNADLVKTTEINDKNQQATDAGIQARDAAGKKAFTDRQASRDKELSDIDAQLKAVASEPAKDALEKRKAGLEAAGKEDRAQFDFQAGKLDAAQLAAELEKSKNIGVNANTQIAAADKKQADQADKQADEATASSAAAAIESLGPNRQQLQETHAAVQELDKGHAEGAAQLGQILVQLVATTKSLTTGQATLFQNILNRLSEVEKNLNAHGNALNSLRNNFHS